jgi:hypothetical protein
MVLYSIHVNSLPGEGRIFKLKSTLKGGGGMGANGLGWTGSGQGQVADSGEHAGENSVSIKCGLSLDKLRNC